MLHPLHVNVGPFSIYGTGVSFYGCRRLEQDRYCVTRWLTILWLPVLPLSTWIIRPIGMTFVNMGALMIDRHKFEVVERPGLDARAVLRTYVTGYLTLLIAVGPVAAVI